MSRPLRELRGQVAMGCLIAAEAAVFSIFVVAYLFYLGKSASGPQPRDVLHAPVAASLALLASSLTIHAGVKALAKGNVPAFARWWWLTFALGAAFLAATAVEWHHLISVDGLTIRTNLFGTTYFSLVGLHACHVAAGLGGLAIASTLAVTGAITRIDAARADVFSLYWHFVDSAWVVVFLVVYVVGR